jgi:hypothetical protein
MLEYPKIETLFLRDKDTFKVTPWNELRLPEFARKLRGESHA